MKHHSFAWSFLAGLLFGAGLLLAGMTQPERVVGFLDVFGRWDPTLAFVMAGALAVHAVTLRLVLRRRAPLFADRFHLPTKKDLDARLLGGAAIFGAGWGLGGYCPGPALVSAGGLSWAAGAFVLAMTLGMAVEHAAARRRDARAAALGEEASP